MNKKRFCLKMVGMIIILAALLTTTAIAFGANKSAASLVEDAPATYVAERIENPTTEVKVPEVLKYYMDIEYEELESKEEIETELVTCKDYEYRLINLMGNKEMVDYTEEIREEIEDVRVVITAYEQDIAAIEEEEARIEAMWAEKSAQYPVATQVWRYMKEELGWNDYVCAGVMGNMMAEVGGQTLNLQPHLYGHDDSSYYGLCQWSKRYYPSVIGASIEGQLDFLRDTVQGQLNTYGYLYRSGMKYEQFCSLTDAKEAALAFAKAYERCGSGSYGVRQTNAMKALDYFTN